MTSDEKLGKLQQQRDPNKALQEQALKRLLEVENLRGEPGKTPKKGVDYFTRDEINAIVEHIQSKLVDLYKPKKGVDYWDGRDGYSPMKDIDYTDGKNPEIGVDYWTEDDKQQVINEVMSRIPKPKDGISPDIGKIIKQIELGLSAKFNKHFTKQNDFVSKDDLVSFLKKGGFRGGGSGGGSGTLSPLTTKGDLYTYDTANSRIGVGADGYILVADSAETTGLKWIANPAVTASGTQIETFDLVAQTVITLVGTPVTNVMIVSLNGLVQERGNDYTVTGANFQTITFASAKTGDVSVYYGINLTAASTYSSFTITAGTTVASATTGEIVYSADSSGGNIILTIPTAIGNTAKYNIIKTSASNTVTVQSVTNINGSASQIINFNNTSITLVSTGSVWQIT